MEEVKQAVISDFTGAGIETIVIIKQKLITLCENYFEGNSIRLGYISKTVQIEDLKSIKM